MNMELVDGPGGLGLAALELEQGRFLALFVLV